MILLSNSFAYETIDPVLLENLTREYRAAYEKNPSEMKNQIERESESFKQFRYDVNNWLLLSLANKMTSRHLEKTYGFDLQKGRNSMDSTSIEKKNVEKYIKILAEKKNSPLSNHLVMQFNSIKGNDVEAISKMLQDIDSIIVRYKEILSKFDSQSQ